MKFLQRWTGCYKTELTLISSPSNLIFSWSLQNTQSRIVWLRSRSRPKRQWLRRKSCQSWCWRRSPLRPFQGWSSSGISACTPCSCPRRSTIGPTGNWLRSSWCSLIGARAFRGVTRSRRGLEWVSVWWRRSTFSGGGPDRSRFSQDA